MLLLLLVEAAAASLVLLIGDSLRGLVDLTHPATYSWALGSRLLALGLAFALTFAVHYGRGVGP